MRTSLPVSYTHLDVYKRQIFLGTELIPNDMAPFLPLEKPLLVVDNSLSCLPVSSVTMDNQQAIFSVVEHLAQLGYKKIGFFYNSLPASNDQERRAAFQNAMHHLGLPFDTRLVFPVSVSYTHLEVYKRQVSTPQEA